MSKRLSGPSCPLPCWQMGVFRTNHVSRGALVAGLGIAFALAAAGCGGSNDSEPGGSNGALPSANETAGFPNPASRSLRELIRNMRQGPELAPSVGLLERGKNRFGFALFDRGNKQIGGLRVALYLSRGLDETAHGPYAATYERIEIARKYRSRQTISDPDSASAVYVTHVPLWSAGGYTITAIAQLGGGLVATSPVQVMVSERTAVPGPGDRAIRVHTPTVESVGGQIKQIDTRIPPDTMHEVDLANALDRHRPLLLLFSTPALCQSRVCGPVTDIAEEVKPEFAGRVDFIHMEIYNHNDVSKGLRPQVRAWHLRQEPFAFAINSRGKVVERIQGAFSANELRAAVRKALG
jgi:hypothetical protein